MRRYIWGFAAAAAWLAVSGSSVGACDECAGKEASCSGRAKAAPVRTFLSERCAPCSNGCVPCVGGASLKDVLGRLDAGLQRLLPCRRCQAGSRACEQKAGCDAKCGCTSKAAAQPVAPPPAPAHSPVTEGNPFGDDAPPATRRPAAKPAPTPAPTPAPNGAAAPTTNAPRYLPTSTPAVPLKRVAPSQESVLRKNATKTADASNAIYVAPLSAPYTISDDDRDAIVRPIPTTVAQTLTMVERP